MNELRLLVAKYEKAKETQKKMSELMVYDSEKKTFYFIEKENKKRFLKQILETIKNS
jgi:hypothetical protein